MMEVDRLIITEQEEAASDLGPPAIQSVKSNRRLFRRRHLASLLVRGVGLLAVCGCVGLASWWLRHAGSRSLPSGRPIQRAEVRGACDHARHSTCSARSLLDMPEVQELASQNILRLGHRILGPHETPTVKAIVRGCFQNVSMQLEGHSQQAARELDTVQFTWSQRDATLNSLQLLADPLIELLGLDIAEAISNSNRTFAAPAADAWEASAELTSMLTRFKIDQLWKELKLARLLWSEGDQWGLTLESEHLHSMAKVSREWRWVITQAAQHYADEPGRGVEAAATEEDRRLAVTAGALVQARVLLDIVRVRVRSAVPTEATALTSYLGMDRQQVSCDLTNPHAFLNKIACPLKFGIQGMDALRAYFSEQSPHRNSLAGYSHGMPGANTVMR